MRPSNSWLLLILLLPLACVRDADENGRPCPCSSGWSCCPSTGTCVADGQSCPVTGSGLDGDSCQLGSECSSGLCLYSQEGCGASGACASMCPVLDACVDCNLHCGCDGVTIVGCTNRPYRSEGACMSADRGEVETGPADAGKGGACMTAGDCPQGWVCLFWSEGCSNLGVCAATCPRLDACGGGCNAHCGCDGVTFEGCATRPFSHRGFCSGGGDP